ncbi:nucleotide exchange factor GrpE [bacterium]|nr:nucleotide exchange factor GrpE [bacterium]
MTVQDTPEYEAADLEGGEPEAAAAGADVDAQLREVQDRLLRTQAELENFRKRSRREYEDAQRYREIDLLRDLLPVLDNAHRAIDAADKTADVESLRSGFRMMAQQLEKLLGSHGCLTIETDGAPFDPTIHDAYRRGASSDDFR